MHILLNNTSMVPIYEQLMAQIKAAVIEGEMKAGDVLPSVRTLASELKISALTVKKAYDKLEEEGYVITVHGKGSFIAQADTQLAEEARKREAEKMLDDALSRALASGMTADDIRELMEILLEDR